MLWVRRLRLRLRLRLRRLWLRRLGRPRSGVGHHEVHPWRRRVAVAVHQGVGRRHDHGLLDTARGGVQAHAASVGTACTPVHLLGHARVLWRLLRRVVLRGLLVCSRPGSVCMVRRGHDTAIHGATTDTRRVAVGIPALASRRHAVAAGVLAAGRRRVALVRAIVPRPALALAAGRCGRRVVAPAVRRATPLVSLRGVR